MVRLFEASGEVVKTDISQNSQGGCQKSVIYYLNGPYKKKVMCRRRRWQKPKKYRACCSFESGDTLTHLPPPPSLLKERDSMVAIWPFWNCLPEMKWLSQLAIFGFIWEIVYLKASFGKIWANFAIFFEILGLNLVKLQFFCRNFGLFHFIDLATQWDSESAHFSRSTPNNIKIPWDTLSVQNCPIF